MRPLRRTYIADMRPQDILMPVAAGLCCKPGGFHIDPVRAGRARRDHPRPFRPRPPRPWRGAGDAGDARHDAAALRRAILPARPRPSPMARKSGSATSRSSSIPPAMCWARRRSRSSCEDIRIVASGDYKDAPDPTCAPLEVVPCDVFITEATFGLPVFRHGDAADEVKKLLASVALFPGARASGRRLFARQGAARDRAVARGRLRCADLSARRDGEDHALLSEPRRRAGRAAPGQGR